MKYKIVSTSYFKKELKIIKKRQKDLKKLDEIVEKLANKEQLSKKYKDHKLMDTIRYKNCRELHIEPDWLLVYRYDNNRLILVLVETGSHSDLF